MKQIAAFFAIFQLLFVGAPALAQDYYGGTRTVVTQSWVEEWDPVTQQWVRVSDVSPAEVEEVHVATRYAQPIAPRGMEPMLAQYGPFVVTSPTRAQLVGSTDRNSPAQFDAMLRDFPEIAVLDMVEAPGTSNDIANLKVARRIRAEGIATHVPNGGSVRSGAVEIFLAGATRTMDDGALFAVHSWLDNHGREADDFPPDHAAHRLYIDFYVEMGMTERQAREFYAMTNSVPHSEALWLRAEDIRPWLREERKPAVATPVIRIAEAAPVLPSIDYSDLTKVTLAQLTFEQPQAA